jgi:hypothetical protein
MKWISDNSIARYNGWNVNTGIWLEKFKSQYLWKYRVVFVQILSGQMPAPALTCTHYILHTTTYDYIYSWRKKFGVLKIPTRNSILQRSATKRPQSTILTISYQEATIHDINYQLPSTISYYEATISTLSYHINDQLPYEQSAIKRQEARLSTISYSYQEATISYHCFLGGSLIPPSRFLFNIGPS